MYTLMQAGRNIRQIYHDNDKRWEMEIECVLAMHKYEYEYELTADGITKASRLETVRFTLKPSSARELAESLLVWAESAERAAAEANIENDKNKDQP